MRLPVGASPSLLSLSLSLSLSLFFSSAVFVAVQVNSNLCVLFEALVASTSLSSYRAFIFSSPILPFRTVWYGFCIAFQRDHQLVPARSTIPIIPQIHVAFVVPSFHNSSFLSGTVWYGHLHCFSTRYRFRSGTLNQKWHQPQDRRIPDPFSHCLTRCKRHLLYRSSNVFSVRDCSVPRGLSRRISVGIRPFHSTSTRTNAYLHIPTLAAGRRRKGLRGRNKMPFCR